MSRKNVSLAAFGREVAMLIITLFVVASMAVSCKPGKTDPGSTAIVETTFTVTVDRSRTVAEAVKAGHYGLISSDVNDRNFPVSRSQVKEETEITLLHFGKAMTFEQVWAEMKKRGLWSADIMQMLSIGEQKPELQKQFLIVGLDSVWQTPHGYRYVPYLHMAGSVRRLNLYCLELGWRDYYRFACVRRKQ